MNDMSIQGLLKRPNGYYFQARIPKRYASHYPEYPSQNIREKLSTENYMEAKGIVRKKWAELQEQYDRIDSTGSLLKVTPSGLEADNLIAKAIHSRMLADEQLRANGLDDLMYEKLDSWATEADEAERLVISRGILTQRNKDIVADWLQGYGYLVDDNSENFKQFAIKFFKAQAQVTKAIRLRATGESVETPPAPSEVSSLSLTNWDSLDKLKEYWLLQPAKASGGKKSRTSIAEADSIIKKFRKLVGDLKPSEVTRSHVAELKDKMLEAGSSPATINKGRSILAAIFSTAEKNSKLAINPFRGMEKMSVSKGDIERLYNIEELKVIFNSPIYSKGERPKRFQGESAFWIPLLALYSGARLNELGQIYAEDVSIEDEINFYTIKPDASTGRTVKDGNRRRVPIHPDLIKMGFLDYVAKIKSENHVQLFPELKVTRVNGKLADKFGDWWCSYVRKDLGNTRIPQPTHGFRHTFIAHGTRCKLDFELRRIIEGHVSNSIDRKSYETGGFPIEPLYDELQKLTFKGLDLSHLYK